MPEKVEPAVHIIEFEPTYRKNQQGFWVLDTTKLPLPASFKVTESPRLAYFEPGGWGGNHRHRRREVQVSLGNDLWLVWRNAAGQRHEVCMGAPGKLKLFVLAPLVPHLVENRAKDRSAVLYELVDSYDGPAELLVGTESLRL